MLRGQGRAFGRASQWAAVVSVGVLAVLVGVLAVFAYERGNPRSTTQDAAPVPTFVLGVTSTPTPSPTPASTAITAPASDRFLAIGSGAWWRAESPRCGAGEPRLDRSTDRGATWSDVTPRYQRISQILAVDAFLGAQADMVTTLGAACDLHALRTYTQGQFWDSYPDVLAASTYVDPADRGVVHIGGDVVEAPCAAAHGLRAEGDTVALICDGSAFVWDAGGWISLVDSGVHAVAAAGAGVVVAHRAVGCDGMALTRFSDRSPTDLQRIACARIDAPSAPAALAADQDQFVLWDGAQLVAIP